MRVVVRNVLLFLAAGVIVPLLVGGCASNGTLTSIEDVPAFDRQVLRASQPVVVEFYKEDCPTCVVQEGTMEKLAAEYSGRVTFAKFKIREATMQSTNPQFMDQYRLFWVPTEILFVNGQEKHRWTLANYPASDFRPALDEAIATAKSTPPATAAPPAQRKSNAF